MFLLKYSLIACVIWIISLISGFFAVNFSEEGKTWFCLISPACMNISLTSLEKYESAVLGLQWYNIDEEYENFRFSTAITMFWVDYVLYLLLALYFDHVWPSRYGGRYVPWFCLLPSYWKGIDVNQDESHIKDLEVSNNSDNIYDGETFEDISEKFKGIEPSIKIRNLHKHYFGNIFSDGGKVVKAVNGINLDIYEGEVFCLLGHNGMYCMCCMCCLCCLYGLVDVEVIIHSLNLF